MGDSKGPSEEGGDAGGAGSRQGGAHKAKEDREWRHGGRYMMDERWCGGRGVRWEAEEGSVAMAARAANGGGGGAGEGLDDEDQRGRGRGHQAGTRGCIDAQEDAGTRWWVGGCVEIR